ncbi:hypothetical protein NPIL_111481 [Nephila pilipes]|uniref:Uncharacterized protein n=1 Tax=Nephila pilipes TaxID=299642 RepID=A0A8X6N7L2_NEPPI|nr:hypothetical protein NPIL_111481 [Nephila pilipes]
MTDVIALVIETCVYLLYWFTFGSGSPSFVEILCYSIVVEVVKMCSFLQFPVRSTLGGGSSVEVQENSVDVKVSVENSFAVNDCLAPDLKVDLDPETQDAIVKPSKADIVPVVHSEVVYSFCQALDLRAKLAPVETRVVFDPPKRLKKQKVVPVVHSKIVFSICLALNLEAELAN